MADPGKNLSSPHRCLAQGKYRQFGLVLTLTAECNLRCCYCYMGEKSSARLDESTARIAIDRALNSLVEGGRLELGFFGGEPLLEAKRLLTLANYAREQTRRAGKELLLHLTTNGTVQSEAAWQVLLAPDVKVAVSCDGLPEVHDRHRPTRGGQGTFDTVMATLERLAANGKEPSVVMVVCPDSVESLAGGIELLFERGVRFVEPSLDLWAKWSPDDIDRLGRAIARCAELWKPRVGRFGIGWLDDMAARVAGISADGCARCGFGAGEMAVSPGGYLYPCERLIGEDRADSPHRLGRADEGEDFLGFAPSPPRSHKACDDCTLREYCNTTCRCSNFVRSGDVARPDSLLCKLNQFCFAEINRVLSGA